MLVSAHKYMVTAPAPHHTLHWQTWWHFALNTSQNRSAVWNSWGEFGLKCIIYERIYWIETGETKTRLEIKSHCTVSLSIIHRLLLYSQSAFLLFCNLKTENVGDVHVVNPTRAFTGIITHQATSTNLKKCGFEEVKWFWGFKSK